MRNRSIHRAAAAGAVLASIAASIAIIAAALAPARADTAPAARSPLAATVAAAAERADAAAVRALVEAKEDVNAAQVDGMTALHWAAYHDDRELADLLLRAGAVAEPTSRYGVTPLALACRNGNGKLVAMLLAAGADADSALAGGETALMTAARTGRIDAVEALLERGADVDRKERRGQTAIMWAAAEGHAGVVARLLDAGAEFREPLRSGFTPLFFAVREGRVEVVRVLLAAGADVNGLLAPSRPGGRTPRSGASPLILAVENGHFDLALALLEAGADANDRRSGQTALHALIHVRKPNRGDGEDGNPPPIGSGKLTSLDMARALVEHGADVNARIEAGKTAPGRLGRSGATPFFLAALTADAPLLRVLLELGADPGIANADGAPPILAATGVGAVAPGEDAGTEPEVLETLDLLLARGADVDAVDANGETAMHGAAYKNHPRVVAYLAEKGARIDVWNRKNKWGWTPLSIAEGYRVGNYKPSPETVAALHRVLLAAGIQPPASSKPQDDGKTY